MLSAAAPAGTPAIDPGLLVMALRATLQASIPAASGLAVPAGVQITATELPPRLLSALLAVDSVTAASHYQSAVEAAAGGNTPRLLAFLELACAADPASAARATADPAFRMSQPEVQALLARVSTLARLTAESFVHGASAPELEATPEAVLLLAIARSALESHRYADLHLAVRAARLSMEARQRSDLPGPANAEPSLAGWRARWLRPSSRSRPVLAGALRQNLRALWWRWPLLVLFLLWFALGLVVGVTGAVLDWPPLRSALSAWGVGFLVLVVAGFLGGFPARVGSRYVLPSQH